MFIRILSGIIYALVLVAGILYSDLSFSYLMIAFCCLILYEFGNITKMSFPLIATMIFAAIILLNTRYTLLFFGNSSNERLVGIIYLAILMAVILTCFSEKKMLASMGKLLLGMFYIITPFYLAFDFIDNRSDFIWFFVFFMVNDTFAYLVGRFLGKHKLAPQISPQKTIEGFIGGVVCSLILGFVLQNKLPNDNFNWYIIALIASVVGTIGDLIESKIKREVGVKDSGNLIPGHGGFLDRLDSFIFALPFIYLYINY